MQRLAEMTPVPAEAEKNTKNVTVNRGPFEVPGFLAGAVESGMRYSGQAGPGADLCAKSAPAAPPPVFSPETFFARPPWNSAGNASKSAGQKQSWPTRESPTHAPAKREKHGRSKWPGLPRKRLAARLIRCSLPRPGLSECRCDLGPVLRSMPGLVKALRPDGWQDAARAIMTTDTVEKMASARVDLGGRTPSLSAA